MRIRELKSELIKRLALFDNPALEARVLLSHFLSLSTSELITRDSEIVPPEKEEMILSALNKRLTGLPMAYITGEKEFFGYLFKRPRYLHWKWCHNNSYQGRESRCGCALFRYKRKSTYRRN